MVTDNFYKAALAEPVFYGYGDSNRPNYLPQGKLTITGYGGTVYKIRDITTAYTSLFSVMSWGISTGTTYQSAGSNISATFGVAFGDGANPVAARSDYALSGSKISTLKGSIDSKGVSESNGVFTANAIYTLTNTGTEEITITEVGLIGLCQGPKADSTNNTIYHVSTLFDHTVLDTPVTIPAGGVGQVEYTITFNYPTST